jgi:hypothetical protein
VASLDDVRRLALAMPETTEVTNREGHTQWKVNDKLFVWQRPLRKSDLTALAALGRVAPDGVIVAARVPDEGAKQALVADDPGVFFTIPHFDGYPAILIRLEQIATAELEEVVVEAWLARAPAKLAAAWSQA